MTESNGWTIDTLRQHIEAQRLADLARLDERWTGHLHYAETQFSNLADRIDAVSQRLDLLVSRVNEYEGQSRGVRVGWTYLVAGIAAVSSLLLILDHVR